MVKANHALSNSAQGFKTKGLRPGVLQPAIGDKIVETLYLTRVTSENKRIRTPPLSPPFKVGVFVVFYR